MSKSRKPVPHVLNGPRGRLQCMRCGKSYDPFKGEPVEIGLLMGITDVFITEHKGCRPTGKERCYACLEEGHVLADHVRLRVLRAVDWPGCGDDGVSSKTVWAHMMGMRVAMPSGRDAPHDPDDFGRCSRLLAAPWAFGWRERLHELAPFSPAWAGLVARWSELEALFAEEYPTGAAPKLYDAMKQCRGER